MITQARAICLMLVLILFATLSFPLTFHAQHGQFPQWVNDAKNSEGMPCCGEKDCIPLQSAAVLEEDGMYADVVINTAVGIIKQYAVVKVKISCPSDDPRPYVCVAAGRDFETKNPDGTSRPNVTPDTVRCLLIPQCMEKNL